MGGFDSISANIISMIPVILSLSVHEWAHAYAANLLGDDTARLQGRMTIDPLAHIDPIGTLLLPACGVPFGWAKPVPVNTSRLTQRFLVRTSMLFIAAAGPISNFILACGSFFILLLLGIDIQNGLTGDNPLYYFLGLFIYINLGLGIFNLIPLAPLDGSKIVDALIPAVLRPTWQVIQTYSVYLLFLLFLAPSLFGFNLVRSVLIWVVGYL